MHVALGDRHGTQPPAETLIMTAQSPPSLVTFTVDYHAQHGCSACMAVKHTCDNHTPCDKKQRHDIGNLQPQSQMPGNQYEH